MAVLQKRLEQRALTVGIVCNAVMGAAGMAVYFVTGLRAIFLDGVFTVIALVSGVVALAVSRRSARTTDRFPNGFFALEPLYALVKAVFTLALLLFSAIGATRSAWEYWRHGTGEPLEFGPVVWYELAMVAICVGLVWFYHHENARIHRASTMLAAEARTTLVDGVVSGGIGIAALALTFVPLDSPVGWLNYTGDFFITVALVAISLREPVGVLRDALVELVGGRVIDEATNDRIAMVVRRHLPGGTTLDHIHVFKKGMSHTVDVYLACRDDMVSVTHLVSSKQAMERVLAERLPIVDVNLVFD
ncbi:cation transporter [Bifidobacterium pullorum subsp. saeculare]|uniref:Cation transporter n=1 Tax=Bifidobacterium pullorum subsp. saeculare TaxID=78257 RepID=A0A938WY03_9BIFI|nr:cation transporter [Bifidobacterium pullorum]MBM6699344.1 cation transporter [Bifidobacterium pullorum subsp. saeculare]